MPSLLCLPVSRRGVHSAAADEVVDKHQCQGAKDGSVRLALHPKDPAFIGAFKLSGRAPTVQPAHNPM